MIHYGCDYYPEQWPEPRWAEDARLMQEASFNVARIGEFAWARMEPREGRYDWGWLDRVLETLAGRGIEVVLGTPTAAPPPWLTAAHPEVLPRDRQRQVRHPGSRRHYCPNSPVYRDYSRRIVGALAGRYGGDGRVIGWQIDNGFGCHETHLCYCDTCAARFREWLRARYGSLEALNEAWGGDFWSALYGDWDEVPLPWPTPSYHNPGHVLDFRRFGSDSTAAYQQVQVDLLRALAPGQFVTHNFMPFGSRELDLYDLVAPLDLREHLVECAVEGAQLVLSLGAHPHRVVPFLRDTLRGLHEPQDRHRDDLLEGVAERDRGGQHPTQQQRHHDPRVQDPRLDIAQVGLDHHAAQGLAALLHERVRLQVLLRRGTAFGGRPACPANGGLTAEPREQLAAAIVDRGASNVWVKAHEREALGRRRSIARRQHRGALGGQLLGQRRERPRLRRADGPGVLPQAHDAHQHDRHRRRGSQQSGELALQRQVTQRATHVDAFLNGPWQVR